MILEVFVVPIAGIDVRNSVTRSLPSTPSGSSYATRSTSSGLRVAFAIADFTLARALRAATAARDAATRSTSGGELVARGEESALVERADAVGWGVDSDTHGSILVDATRDGVG